MAYKMRSPHLLANMASSKSLDVKPSMVIALTSRRSFVVLIEKC